MRIRRPGRPPSAARLSPVELISYLGVLGLAVVVRLLTARAFVAQVDEPASLLAIRMVADTGVPILPSGVLYLQGAVLSYLAAPLAWFLDGERLLESVRIGNVALSVLVVPLSMRLVRYVTGSLAPAVWVGVLVALEPSIILWGVAVRPYGVLTVLNVALVWVATILVVEGRRGRIGPMPASAWMVALLVVGTFTHIGIWLSFPAVVMALALAWGRELWRSERPLAYAVGGSLLAPLSFLLLANRIGVGSGTSDGGRGPAFTGSHVFDLGAVFDRPAFTFNIWLGNFYESLFSEVLPFVIAAASGVLVGACLAAGTTDGLDAERRWRRAVFVLVAAYWVPVVVVSVIVTIAPLPRYVVQVLPLGHALLGVAGWQVWRALSTMDRAAKVALRSAGIAMLLLPTLVHGVQGAWWRMDFAGSDPDYLAASAYAASQHRPGQAVISALPPAAYFVFDEATLNGAFYFLAGPEDGARATWYVRRNADGVPGDYWLGIDPITSTTSLCGVMSRFAGNAWIIVDKVRLTATWALAGEMAEVVIGGSEVAYAGANGAQVRSVLAKDRWSETALEICAGNGPAAGSAGYSPAPGIGS